MCGIAAFIGDSRQFDGDRFAMMAKLASRRGRDSSGLGRLQDGVVSVVHEIGADDRARRRLFAGMTFPTRGRFGMVFHSRLATDGRIGSPLESQPLVRDNNFIAFNGLINWQDPASAAALRFPDGPKGANDTWNLLRVLTSTTIEEVEELIAGIPYEMNFLWARESTLYAYTNVGSLYRTEVDGSSYVASECGIIKRSLSGSVPEPLPMRELIVVGKV